MHERLYALSLLKSSVRTLFFYHLSHCVVKVNLDVRFKFIESTCFISWHKLLYWLRVVLIDVFKLGILQVSS